MKIQPPPKTNVPRVTSIGSVGPLFDHLPADALVLWDPEFRITGVNRSAETLFGMSSEEMLGKHCREVFRATAEEPGPRSVGGNEQAAHGDPYDRP